MDRFYIDEQKCVGCRICELACSFQHGQQFNPENSKIRIYFTDDGRVEITRSPCDCKLMLCVDYCPVQAIRPKPVSIAVSSVFRMFDAIKNRF